MTLVPVVLIGLAVNKINELRSTLNQSYNILNIRMFQFMVAGLASQIFFDLFLTIYEYKLQQSGRNGSIQNYWAVVLTTGITMSLRQLFNALIQFFQYYEWFCILYLIQHEKKLTVNEIADNARHLANKFNQNETKLKIAI